MKGFSFSRITIDPAICYGKPTVRGLRYPVETILGWMASGMTHAQILEDYGDLEEEDLLECLLFAKQIVQVKHIGKLIA